MGQGKLNLEVYRRDGKRKSNSTKRIIGKAKDGSIKSVRDKVSGKKGISASRGCRENLNPKKRVIIKNDGRYLIYYNF